jgi:hypothetical protein
MVSHDMSPLCDASGPAKQHVTPIRKICPLNSMVGYVCILYAKARDNGEFLFLKKFGSSKFLNNWKYYSH